MGSTSVLITTEGTYPCYHGGVSVWCDYLVRELTEVDFHVFALTHAPSVTAKFKLPSNVASCRLHPIWGTEEPGAYDLDLPRNHARKARTTDEDIHTAFLPHFEAVANCVLDPDSNADRLARGLYGIHCYSRKFDYASSIGSRMAWDAFVKCAMRSDLDLTLDDATCCMRWLQRYLSVLAIQYPKVDLVHASLAGLAGVPGVLCKLAHGSQYLLTEHGLHLRELYMTLSRCPYSRKARAFLMRFNQAITRMSYRYADQITCLGEFNRRWQIKLGADPSKTTIVPNGVNPQSYYPRTPPPRTRPTIITLARIMPIKGIELLIRATAEIRDRLPDINCLIFGDVGDPQYFKHCQELVESLSLKSNVEFGVTHDSASAYQLADVFCLASLSEGMPFAVIEAMMSGCPVVATDVGSVRDLLGGFGELVKPNHPEELAAAILGLLTGPNAKERRDAMATAARKRALENFTIESFSRNFREIYQDIRYAATAPLLSRTAN